VAIDLGADGDLDEEDITFLDVTSLTDQQGMPFEPGTVDAESIVMARPGQLVISSEGEVDAGINPFINRFNLEGKQTRPLNIPEKFLIGGDNQVRDNLNFESLTVTPDMRHLFTATENALLNDGPVATLTDPSPSRFLQYYFFARRPGPEYVYMVSPIPAAPVPPDAFADNGLVEIEALDNQGTFLAMERSFAVGVGNIVRLFETSTMDATNVSGYEVLPDASEYEPMDKVLVADFETDLGVDPDNLEAMRFGPTLPDGRRLLIVVSDNNFNPTQTTQFIALAVELVPADENDR
jgi:3-phytase/alkaline phosphatase D